MYCAFFLKDILFNASISNKDKPFSIETHYLYCIFRNFPFYPYLGGDTEI